MAISGASGKVIPTGIALVEMACATHAGARESANATLQISRTERLPELAARMWGFVIGLYSSLQSSLVRNVSLAWSVMNIGVAENTIYAVKSPIFSPSSQSATDPLSDVLSLLKPKNYMGGGIDAGGEWCFYFGELNVTRCFALASGSCWLEMDGVADPVHLVAGECVLMPHGRAFRLASNLALEAVDAMKHIITQPMNGRIIPWNGGGGTVGFSAIFSFDGEHASMLLGALPPLMHLRDESKQATMQWCLERMMRELREAQPGGFLLGQHLAHIMLVEALRLYLSNETSNGVGWLLALGDKQMRSAMTAMHEDPAHGWSLQELAERAGMSRSKFAFRFKEKVGVSAMEYLTRWRMLRAADRLTNSPESVADIAVASGYESESSFGAAFKKVMGLSPRQYCRARAAASLEFRHTAHP